MAAYVIAKIKTNTPELLKDYQSVTPDIIAKYGGKFIVRGGDIINLEGKEETRRIVIVEFPTIEKAKEFFYSAEYQKAIKLREDIATFEMFAIGGV